MQPGTEPPDCATWMQTYLAHIHRPKSGMLRYISSYCLAIHPAAFPPLAMTPKAPAIHSPVIAAATPLMMYHRLFLASSRSPFVLVTWFGVYPIHFAQPQLMWKHPTVINKLKPTYETTGCVANAWLT